jgi:hypothetical protein
MFDREISKPKIKLHNKSNDIASGRHEGVIGAVMRIIALEVSIDHIPPPPVFFDDADFQGKPWMGSVSSRARILQPELGARKGSRDEPPLFPKWISSMMHRRVNPTGNSSPWARSSRQVPSGAVMTLANDPYGLDDRVTLPRPKDARLSGRLGLPSKGNGPLPHLIPKRLGKSRAVRYFACCYALHESAPRRPERPC